MSEHLQVSPVNRDHAACTACGSHNRVVSVAAGAGSKWVTRFCQQCVLELMGALTSLYGVEPPHVISNNPQQLEFERLSQQLYEARATVRRLQAHAIQGN